MTYESDITRFVREMKARDPDLERKQREGRALWWDRNLDLDELRRRQAARVPQAAYVYLTQPKAADGNAA